ncbi:MAG: hypothetical protein A3I66_09805 [Burkholderiales bacterium RIFCSPLOWO2_02_FULL_57_36]|nr:MAG: hypothetical protein A3I66_09805 [Burkholderiales bacterium RIFCSPLOWO2_02_FULL_57_36]
MPPRQPQSRIAAGSKHRSSEGLISSEDAGGRGVFGKLTAAAAREAGLYEEAVPDAVIILIFVTFPAEPLLRKWADKRLGGPAR